MKYFVLLFCLLTTSLYSQSAVYFCTTNGASGWAYGFEDEYSAQEAAYNECLEQGGENPQLVISTDYAGAGAVAMGKATDGTNIIGAAVGFEYMFEAEAEAKAQCRKLGAVSDIRIVGNWDDRD